MNIKTTNIENDLKKDIRDYLEHILDYLYILYKKSPWSLDMSTANYVGD